MSTSDVRGGRNASSARGTGQQRQNSTVAETNRKVASKPAQPNINPNNTITQNEDVSLASFNVEEVEKLLSKGMRPQAQAYVVNQELAQAKSSPWGKKAGAMANGRDFWLELRKQVTALRQSGGVSQGG